MINIIVAQAGRAGVGTLLRRTIVGTVESRLIGRVNSGSLRPGAAVNVGCWFFPLLFAF